jgi:PAS domain S-box-containing protein
MEKALRLSEEKFSKAFLASPYAIIISTIEDGRLIEVSDSFLQVTGFSREESIGHTALELGLWRDASGQNEILREIQDAGRVRSKEITYQIKGGKQLPVNYSATAIELGGRRCLLSVCEDITERKRAEERLREYEKALGSVEEMIAVVDREYRFLLANHSFLNVLGLKEEEVVGRLVTEVIESEYFEPVAKGKLEEAFCGKIVKDETKYTFPQIGQREILVSYFPIEGAVCVDRVVCVGQDISDRKRAEAELRRLSGQLLHSQDEERRKIARDLHDSTGQDLVALVTTLSQLHDAIPSANRTRRRLASQCQAIAERSLREVRTLSYLLHPPMLDASGLEDAIRHFADGFGRRTGIEVDLEISPQFGRLPEDLELGLFRVVQESLTNIQRHSGSFTAKLQLNRNPGKILLEVSDTGRGIFAGEPEHEGRFPLSKGVGIPSMEERVKQIGGRLEIKSSSNGTIVRVAVPCHD